jgi:murein DD-endopeptidase MepM/ murein hydrolase activator NlpD
MRPSLDSRLSWTIVTLRRPGHPNVRFRLPARPGVALGWLSAIVLCCTCFVGWELQGQLGGNGPRALRLGTAEPSLEYWSRFEQSVDASGELRGRSALVHATQLGLGSRIAASQLWAGNISKEWSEAAGDGESSDGTLLFPVYEGRHVRGYGSGRNSYHLAVDISGARGSNVLAAAPGIVGYVGNEMSGYGNLLIIVHAGGRATFYGHNDRILVLPGERVTQGQPVAVLGSTGNSLGPHVHFELVTNRRNCDPEPLFRASLEGQAIANLPRVKQAIWETDAPKPRAIRCATRRAHPGRHDHDGEGDVASNVLNREPLASLTTGRSRNNSAL